MSVSAQELLTVMRPLVIELERALQRLLKAGLAIPTRPVARIESAEDGAARVVGQFESRSSAISPELEASASFYGQLFGWSIAPSESSPQRYLSIRNGDANNGGMRELNPPEPPHWLVYFGTERVEADLARVEGLGGATLAGPIDIHVGEIGIVQDPQGAVFGLYAGQLVVAPARRLSFAGESACAGESHRRPGWATMGAEMAAHAKRIEIAVDDRPVLQRWANARAAERRLVDRARIVLLAGEGRPAGQIAKRVGCSLPTVKTWRARYQRDGLDGLRDRPKTGRPLTHGSEVRAKLIALACTRPPDTDEGVRRERWTHAELAEQVGMSESQAHAILRSADIRPHLTEQWVMSELGPDFDVQAADVCGLYLDPPQNAIVVSIDEKTSIAAREPARPDTLAGTGRPPRRDTEYIRNGTANLFAALAVHHGEVSGMTSPTRNRWDFITFLEQLEAEIPADRQVIAILDNLSTHKTREVDAWLAAHPRWRFAFTPKHASWLNRVECFFSILARRLLRHGAFSDPEDLATQMLAFVEHYNLTAQPFNWTYTNKVLTT